MSKKQFINTLCIVLFSILVTIFFNEIDWNEPQRFFSDPQHTETLEQFQKFIGSNTESESAVSIKKDLSNERPEGTSFGMSLFLLPFALLTGFLSKIFSFEWGIYSPAFVLTTVISAVAYTVLGVYYLLITIRNKFSKATLFISAIGIVFGTNLFIYSTSLAFNPFSYIFFLNALILYLLFGSSFERKEILISGLFLFSLIVVVQNVAILPLLLYYNKKLLSNGLSGKITFITFFILLPITTVLFISFYSSGIRIEEIISPKLAGGLFEYRKGLFIYSPILFFSFIGLVLGVFKGYIQLIKATIILCCFLILSTINLSWWNWWFGESFGQPYFICFYGILAYPLAVLIESIVKSKVFALKFWGVIFLLFFVYLNVFQTWQYQNGILSKDGMTESLYWESFGETHERSILRCLSKAPNYKVSKQARELIVNETCVNEKRIDPFELLNYKQNRTAYNAEGNILFKKEEKISLYYKLKQKGSAFTVSLDENDRYKINFILYNEIIDSMSLEHNDPDFSGMKVYESGLSDIIKEKGFDKIEIIALEGDDLYSVGHLIIY